MIPPQTVTSPLLVYCRDLETYVSVAESYAPIQGKGIPIFGVPPLISGFPRGTVCVSRAQWQASTTYIEPTSTTPRLWCVALDGPVCAAVGHFLARSTGRSLLVSGDDDWEYRLQKLLEEHEVESLVFIVPSWEDGSGRPDSRWLRRILAHVRSMHGRLRNVAWGIMTGVNPTALSVVAAKSLLQREIVASYAPAPAAMFITEIAAELGIDLPLASPDEKARLQIVEQSHLRSGASASITQHPWNLLYFRGHGRSYCACQGHLCGARPLTVAPTSFAERCVQGMECASPRNDAYRPGFLAFPRIDPRCYDTPLMIIDCCGSGGWSSPDWDSGIPSLSIHAASGAPSAVITSDYTTVSTRGDYMDVFQVLWSSRSVGEATSHLNRIRPYAGAEFPYFLLGDPECPSGAARWPDWCAEATIVTRREGPEQQPQLIFSAPIGTPFIRANLGQVVPPRSTTSVHITNKYTASVCSVRVHTGIEDSDVWMAFSRTSDASERVEFAIQNHLTPELPPGLLEAALDAPLHVRSWTEELVEGSQSLLSAVEDVVRVDALLRNIGCSITPSYLEEIQTCIHLCRQAWTDAHLTSVTHALRLSDGGLWPFRLWNGADYSGSTVSDECPYCGTSPTMLRLYTSPPAAKRMQWECVRCMLIEDRPLAPIPSFSIQMPTRLEAGKSILAKITFDNTGQACHYAIGGALLFDQRGHGVKPPPPFAFELPPGERCTKQVALTLAGPPPIHHRYYARLVMLINGTWTLATRAVTLCP